jgi:hypothetical protein
MLAPDGRSTRAQGNLSGLPAALASFSSVASDTTPHFLFMEASHLLLLSVNRGSRQ